MRQHRDRNGRDARRRLLRHHRLPNSAPQRPLRARRRWPPWGPTCWRRTSIRSKPLRVLPREATWRSPMRCSIKGARRHRRNVYKSEVLLQRVCTPLPTWPCWPRASSRASWMWRSGCCCVNVSEGRADGAPVSCRGTPHHPAPRPVRAPVGLRTRQPAVPPVRHTHRTARAGPHARSTYWCPRCQPPVVPAT